eukprot:4395820-Amphidinium_carterae.1
MGPKLLRTLGLSLPGPALIARMPARPGALGLLDGTPGHVGSLGSNSTVSHCHRFEKSAMISDGLVRLVPTASEVPEKAPIDRNGATASAEEHIYSMGISGEMDHDFSDCSR